MENHSAHLIIDTVSRLKWQGINEKSIAEIEARQRERIKALREMLEAEEQELRWIIAARSSSPTEHEQRHGTVHAPARHSEESEPERFNTIA